MDTPAVPARPRRIALIHALRDSIEPILAAFARHWPQAETFSCWNSIVRGNTCWHM